MSARCIECSTEIDEGPLCEDCAPLVAATIKLLKPNKRPASRDRYPRETREEPPVTLAPVRFGKDRT